MKGIVFTELVEMVEGRFGLETADVMLDPQGLASGGVYAATDTYAHAEIVVLLGRLSASTGLSVAELLYAYGDHLFDRLRSLFPPFFEAPRDAFEFIATINDVVHVEVRKLYPDAELPEFICDRVEGGNLLLVYRSPRGLADLAEGLIAGCCRSYGEDVSITRSDLSGGAMTNVSFLLTRRAAVAGAGKAA